jgi:hypothetical protein
MYILTVYKNADSLLVSIYLYDFTLRLKMAFWFPCYFKLISHKNIFGSFFDDVTKDPYATEPYAKMSNSLFIRTSCDMISGLCVGPVFRENLTRIGVQLSR